jgi:hypothetical protein
LVKLEVLVNSEPIDALAAIVHKEEAYHKGQALVSKLKEIIPRQMFDVPIQASSSGRIISRANVKALRKDVLAKCYGGDITRKKEAARKAEKGKTAHEDGGDGRNSPGSLLRGSAPGGRVSSIASNDWRSTARSLLALAARDCRYIPGNLSVKAAH